jgi:hypothetical protein
MHALLSDPDEAAVPGHSGEALLVGTAMLPSAVSTTSALATLFYFEAQSHGLHARCLRFAGAVTDVHARLASGWWPTLPDGIRTRWVP